MITHWNRRLEANPTEGGTYLVCRMNGDIEKLNFGTSKGWENGREKREAKSNPSRRVIAWRTVDMPPPHWMEDWRKLTGVSEDGCHGI
jgi:hypothetical protein